MKKLPLVAALSAFLLAAPVSAATLVLLNTDDPGIGFNDNTAATPVGGNTGTTVGQQRLIAYQRALDLWGSVLKSDVPVVVAGSFAPLSCTASGGVLAQAGAASIFSDFPNAPLASRWYGGALADALAGFDLDPGFEDIIANFNGKVGQPDCIAGPGFYYGLDNAPPPGAIDFMNTFMHEVAHGLGFQNFANEATGFRFDDRADVYMANTRDLDTGKQWDQFTASEIVTAAVKNGREVWSGAQVNANSSKVLGNFTGVRLGGELLREINTGAANFGPAPTADNFSGAIALVNDGAGGSTSDGCEAIVNDVVGKMALIDRGTCVFTVKVKNAQNAGAKAVLIANNAAGAGAPALGGSDPTITIAAVGISREDGLDIKAVLPPPGAGVTVRFFTDRGRRAGVSEGLVRVFAPPVVALGSSISHYDTTASPNLLMEPSITSSLRATRNLDLTPALMQDIGWQMESLKIKSCDTGVNNARPNGELFSVVVSDCIASGGGASGSPKQCVRDAAIAREATSLMTVAERRAITACAPALNP